MTAFNRWYYSFSPHVARVISENQPLRNVVRVSLYPLIGALRAADAAHTAFGFNAELATVMAGLTAALLVGFAYIFPPMILMSMATRKRTRKDQ